MNRVATGAKDGQEVVTPRVLNWAEISSWGGRSEDGLRIESQNVKLV
ncbi:MAG TPA: hypothetical protein VLK65_06455 [Vicinamibacteria bacterium]|nr:hypothetical protein [Vicinamibacteria bacterium]